MMNRSIGLRSKNGKNKIMHPLDDDKRFRRTSLLRDSAQSVLLNQHGLLFTGRKSLKGALKRSTVLSGVVSAAASFMAAPAFAGPDGGSVVGGSASINGQGSSNVVVNQASQKAIIDWRSFSVGASESVRFNQPNSAAISLNRVTGGDPSNILGSMSANGNVWLVNPSGVLFGSSATIDVAGLVASTTNITNSNFMSGNFAFDDATSQRGASVVNRGDITIGDSGLAAFVAPGVSNEGVIVANLGQVTLASGDAFSVDLFGDSLINLAVSSDDIAALAAADGASLAARIVQSGRITADGGRVALTAQDAASLVSQSINMSGVVQANTVSSTGGVITLGGSTSGEVRVTGALNAAGQDAGELGGLVKVLGEKVALIDGGSINASGHAGGGEVLVGGNLLGKGPEQNAKFTVMGVSASIDANALTDGDGGRVIIWSDEYTKFFGTVNAVGTTGRTGGFLETSSKEILKAVGTISLGEGGTWLIDPRNVAITTNNTADGAFNGADPDVFTPTGDDSVADRDDIQDLLNAGTDVTITTGGDGGQAGNITVTDSITKSAGTAATLTLTAAGQIDVNAAIVSTSNALNVVMIANNDGGTGTIDLGDNITLLAGTLSLDTTGGGAGGNAAINQSGGVITSSGTVTITSGTGAITLTRDNVIAGVVTATNTGGQALQITDNRALAVGAITSGGAITLIAKNGAGISLGNGNTNITGTGGVTLTGAAAHTLAGNIVVTATDNNITVNQAINAGSAGTESLTFAAGTGDLDLQGDVGAGTRVNDFAVTSAANANLNDVVADTIAVTATSIDLIGDTYTATVGNATFTGAVDLDGAAITTTVTTSAGNGDIIFTSTIDDNIAGQTDLTLVAGTGDVDLRGNVGATIRIDDFTVTSAANADLINVIADTIAVTATSIDLEGTTYTAAVGGATFTGAVDLDAGAETITVTTTNQTITFTSTIDDNVASETSLTLNANENGNIAVDGAVGNTTVIKDLTITDANNSVFASSIDAEDILVVDTTGTVTVAGLVTASQSLVFTGNNLTLNGAGNNTIGTTMTVNNTGVLTTADTAVLSVNGLFSQTVAGTENSISADINSTVSGIDFEGAVKLDGTDRVTFTAAHHNNIDIGGNLTTETAANDGIFFAPQGIINLQAVGNSVISTTSFTAGDVNLRSLTSTQLVEVTAANLTGSINVARLTIGAGANSVNLTNTTINNQTGRNAWKSATLILPVSNRNGTFRINDVPFGPERDRLVNDTFDVSRNSISSTIQVINNIALNQSNNSSPLETVLSNNIAVTPYFLGDLTSIDLKQSTFPFKVKNNKYKYLKPIQAIINLGGIKLYENYLNKTTMYDLNRNTNKPFEVSELNNNSSETRVVN
jgi:filamentous hemagglutinin family protein